MASSATTAVKRFPARGYHAAYRFNEINRCPGCGRSHWHVGRVSAQCAFCDTAIPFAGGGEGL
jgi:hypothetical protein